MMQQLFFLGRGCWDTCEESDRYYFRMCHMLKWMQFSRNKEYNHG